MNFSRREITLALATCLVLLAGVTYWIVSNKLPAISEAAKERTIVEKKIAVNERLIRKQKPLMAELQGIVNTLPQHDLDKDVKYALLTEISQQAENTQFNIVRRIPGEERKVGNTELYELSVDCTYESTLEPLVYFLYNLQAKGAVMNVSELSVKQASSQISRRGQLKGSFVVDFAYSRVDQAAAPVTTLTPEATSTPVEKPTATVVPAPAVPSPAPPTIPVAPAPGPPALPAPGPPALPAPAAPPAIPAPGPPSPGAPPTP